METKTNLKKWLIVFLLGVSILTGSLLRLKASPSATTEFSSSILPDTGAVQVGVFDTMELVFTAASSPANPFETYLLKLEVTDPDGRVFTVEGFYDGDGQGGQNGKIWKARLTPYKAGLWRWRTVSGDAADAGLADLSGEFQAVANGKRGGLTTQGKAFRFQNGDYVVLVGNFLDFSNGLRTTHTYMSETTTDAQRDAIFSRLKNFHTANKANIYFANKGDYSNQSVTPWLGSASGNDKSRMDLARWKKYDSYLARFQQNAVIAEMWFFADDSNFGALSASQKNLLARYAMARTSAFSHTMYVLALEWQEGWTTDTVRNFGKYIQDHNPWDRAVSVHSLTLKSWSFNGESWADFFASQPGNDSSSSTVNKYSTDIFQAQSIPHLSEEFGILDSNSNTALRNRLWASFAGGAAGVGTGSDSKAFMRFVNGSRIPYQRMKPSNNLTTGSGGPYYTLAEAGHHYMIYSETGAFTVNLSGSNLSGRWFDPRNPNATLSSAFNVASGTRTFTPPSNTSQDWVLWITDGSNLNSGEMYPSAGASMISMSVSKSVAPTATKPPATATATKPPVTPTATATKPPVTPTTTKPPATATKPPVTPTATKPPVTATTPAPTATKPPVQVTTPAPTNPPTPVVTTPAPTPTAPPPVATTPPPDSESQGDRLFASVQNSAHVSGIDTADEDILVFDSLKTVWDMFFDGSDVGLDYVNVDAFFVQPDHSILLSFAANASVPGVGWVDASDIVHFIPGTTGRETSGTFELYFDASDVELTTNAENVDVIAFSRDGKLLISTIGAVSVGGVNGYDEDVLAFTATQWGADTRGSWAMYFDGSDVGLNTTADEDVDGFWVDPANGQIYLSTLGAFEVEGISGDGADIFVCTPQSLGGTTACTFSPTLYWDASAAGVNVALDGMGLSTTDRAYVQDGNLPFTPPDEDQPQPDLGDLYLKHYLPWVMQK